MTLIPQLSTHALERVLQAALALLKTAPSYSLLVAPVPGVKPSARRWAVDPVLAAELQFRMSLLGPCVPKLTEVLLIAIAILSFLEMQHRTHTTCFVTKA